MSDQIVVRDLRKQFPKVLAVDGVDLDVATGEVFGLLGPNGAGKTTTLEMIEGLTTPDAGEITISGLNWAKCQPKPYKILKTTIMRMIISNNLY